MVNRRVEPEFARPVVPEDIGPDGLHLEIEATSEERGRLAERLGLLSLDRMVARMFLAVSPSGVSVKVSGRLQARFSQECVVSLEPVDLEVDEPLVAEFGPAAEETVISLSPGDPEPVEPLVDGRIDLGELVVQHLALTLDPYPRKAGACLPDWRKPADNAAYTSDASPFAVLETLRKKGR